MKKVYLDNAATTQVREEVISKMKAALDTFYGNPSSTHSFGRSAKTVIEKARKTIAKLLNAHPSEIIFTSSGTEADNMILRGAVKDLGVATIITSKIEHHAVLHTINALEKEYDITVHYIDLDASGNPKLSHLESLLKQDSTKKLVSLMHINNEIGNVLDITAVCRLVKENNALFHSDVVQSVGHYSWDMEQTPVDFLAVSAHKFHGPKGVGFAYIKKDKMLKSFIYGGEQERGFRAGTESFHNIVGLEESFVIANTNLEQEKNYVAELKEYFVSSLKKEIPAVKFNGGSGDMAQSTYTLVNVCLPFTKEKASMLLFHLDIKGIACSEGSACQSGSGAVSHVLKEILSKEDMEKPSLRFSFSRYNTKEELDYVVSVLKDFAEN